MPSHSLNIGLGKLFESVVDSNGYDVEQLVWYRTIVPCFQIRNFLFHTYLCINLVFAFRQTKESFIFTVATALTDGGYRDASCVYT